MKILFLSDSFPPEVNAPASRTFEHCREWVRAGHDVTVITCAPNFPKGQVFPGYRNRLRQVEMMEGIRVLRVWSYITANEGFVRRSLDYLSFMATGSIAGVYCDRPDVVVGTSPQLFTVCAAYLVSRLRRRPFVFELRDLWPESIKAVGAMGESRVLKWLERLELFLYRKAAAVVPVTAAFRENLIGRGIESPKIQVVSNGVDLSRYSPRPKDFELLKRHGLEGKFVAGYVGTHGMAHGLETILDAAEQVWRSPATGRFAFLFLGDGAKKSELQQEARRRQLGNVMFLDTVRKEEVPRYWSLLDVSIIHLRKVPLFETVIPSKLFECMGMGIPVLLGVAGESARIVQKTGTGFCFEPGNAAALVDALQQLNASPQLLANCRMACIESAPKYDRRQLATRMLELLLRVARVPD